MKKQKKVQLEKLLNSSGFLFQLAIENLVSSSDNHEWRVISREHPWKHNEMESEGFIDLILSAGQDMFFMVCECKRTKQGEWVFIVENEKKGNVKPIRCLWIAGTSKGHSFSGWDDVNFKPPSPESSFCVIRGSGERGQPLLERLAGNLLLSTDCLADEDIGIVKKRKADFYRGMYIPLIITNATLYICELDINEISITDGTVFNQEFKEVPMVRFRKTLSFGSPPNSQATRIESATLERERTVLVINSFSLIDILSTYSLKTEIWDDDHPWDVALENIKFTSQ